MQPSNDLSSTPRRPLDVEDYIDIVRRHKAWILGPMFAGLVLSVVGGFLWPDTYVSEAAVRVVPQQVPEKYVPSNINEMSQHINALAQETLRRESLAELITSLKLYPDQVRKKPVADVAEQMRKDIHIGPVLSLQSNAAGRTPLSAFSVSFEYPDRHVAQAVTRALVSRFIDRNVQLRSEQSRMTTDFLRDTVAAARKHLEELENRLTAFRVRNAGHLPDEFQANLQTLRTLETQLSGVNEAINRIDQDKLRLESEIRINRDQLASLHSMTDPLSVTVKNDRLTQLDKDILNLEAILSGMRERYKDTYPDVQRTMAQINVLKRMRDELLKQEEQKKPETVVNRPRDPKVEQAAKEIQANIERLQSQIQANNMALDERVKEQKQLQDAIKGYGSRIQSSPITEREYADLTRDYTLAKARYDDLNAKMAQSQLATDLENRKQGETLDLLDAASLPERPAKPNRLLIVGAGIGIGLLFGIFLAGAREVKDTSLKSLKDARAYTNLPVLGTVPLLENDLVVRRKRRLAWLAWSAACMVGILAMTTTIYYYYSTKT